MYHTSQRRGKKEGFVDVGGDVVPSIKIRVMVVLGAAMLAFTIVAWRRGWWTPAGRIHYTMVTLGVVLLLVVLRCWHLF